MAEIFNVARYKRITCISPKTFYKVSITLVPKPDNTSKENHKPISHHLNNDEKMQQTEFSKPNSKQHIKRIIHHYQVGLFLECRNGSTYGKKKCNTLH